MPQSGHRGADPPVHAATRRPADHTSAMIGVIEATGYHPTVVADGVTSALGGEPVTAYVVHHEPTFDHDEVRRHMTVAALTPSRLVVAHTDEHAADDLLPSPYTSTTSEAISLSGVRSVIVSRMVANPEKYPGASLPATAVSEVVLTVGWGAVGRIDLEPATCADPDCEGDHGYTGAVSADDFSLRMSAAADGADAVSRLLAFSAELSRATAGR
ncbi:MAG: DUF5998 family protein [Nocardioidaceae bacterium]